MIGAEENLHFIVQEYVQGQNLSQWFKRNGPPDFARGLKWMKQVAAALRTAAASGIVHRDIKPENIMLTRSEDAKVTDFGLAQLNEPTQKMNLTQAGTTMGTPWYMSPEQIQGDPLDFRTDQYAFGVTCYHMFAGEPPFPGKNSVTVAVQHLKDDPAPLRQHRRDLPESLCRVIHKMMAKKPEDRYATPEELQQAFNSLDGESPQDEFVDTSSFGAWLRSSIPSGKMLTAGLLLCGIVGAAGGQQLFRPLRLEVKTPDFPMQETAARQYAEAILNPTNESAWRAVFDYHPNTEEALWAHVQLGCYQLSRDNAAKAIKEFRDLAQEASTEPGERKRQFQFLATLGEAVALQDQLDAAKSAADDTLTPEQKKKADEIATRLEAIELNTLMDEYKGEFDRNAIAAPRILGEYFELLRQRREIQRGS